MRFSQTSDATIRYIAVLFVLTISAVCMHAQTALVVSLQEHEIPEKPAKPWLLSAQPEFPGGMPALEEYVASHLKLPDFLLEQGFYGEANLILNLDSAGLVSSISLKNIPMSEADLQIVWQSLADMPRWQPALQAGRNIPSKISVPLLIRR